jgi:hypothetical protein
MTGFRETAGKRPGGPEGELSAAPVDGARRTQVEPKVFR